MSSNPPKPLPGLPSGITSRIVVVNELDVHILEAGKADPDQPSKPPLLILLHGFPEFCYSWRKIMIPLAKHGFYVVAPDQRGFGQTTLRRHHSPLPPPRRAPDDDDGKIRFDEEDDLTPYGSLNLAADIVSLVNILGYTSVASVIGHDFGSMVASYCALVRPDLFKSVVIMSSPFTGPPSLSELTNPNTTTTADISKPMIHRLNELLAILDPPRKHYTMYFSTPEANTDMSDPKSGLHTFLRTYFHVKSGDWKPNNNNVRQLEPSISSMSTMPHYYIMPLYETMPSCLDPFTPTIDEIKQNKWLTEDELSVYVNQFTQTGFQGGLNWYRCQTDPKRWAKLDIIRMLVGKQIEIPAMFL